MRSVSMALLIFLIAVLTAVISDLLRALFLFSISTRFFADLIFGTLVLLLLVLFYLTLIYYHIFF